jgi:hypothetical protein
MPLFSKYNYNQLHPFKAILTSYSKHEPTTLVGDFIFDYIGVITMSYTSNDILRNCGINLSAYNFIHHDYETNDTRSQVLIYGVTRDYLPSLMLYRLDSRDYWIKEHVFSLDLKGDINYTKAKIAFSDNGGVALFACPTVNIGGILIIYKKISLPLEQARNLPPYAPLTTWQVVRTDQIKNPQALRHVRLSPNGTQYAYGETTEDTKDYRCVL